MTASTQAVPAAHGQLSLKLSDEEIDTEIKAGRRLLTVAEVAYMFKKTPATIREYFNKGWLRGIKINSMWHTIEPEILRYLREGRFQDGNENPA